MALGVASPWRRRFEPSARTQEGAEAEDGDQRSAGGEGAHRRAGASGWSPTTRPRFFSQGLATCRRASGASPGAWRDQLFALIKDLSAAEKSQGENETTSAPEKAIHEVQHLCQLAQLSRAAIIVISRRVNPSATTPAFAMRSIASHYPTASTAIAIECAAFACDRQAIEARRTRRQLQAGASVDAAR